MTLDIHVAKSCRSAYYHLYSIGRVRQYLSQQCARQLVHALVISRLDGCNNLLVDLPDTLLHRRERVQNACAMQDDTWEGQVRACHVNAQGASLVAYQKPHPVQSTINHI